ncbi:MAG: ATP-binding protein [Bacillota bacterium]|jgi:predicted AAA+ superfamily ATPase
MQLTSEANIFSVLLSYNPWWRTDHVPKELTKRVKRLAFYEVMAAIEHPDIRRMALISGARRIGKTTMLYQMIERLIEQGADSKRLLYVSLDHPLLKLCPLNRVLEIYHQNVYGEQDVFYFFDELQYANDWDFWLKTIFDTQPATRVVATGSASPRLLDRAIESGVGRWKVISVPTLSFYEYCELLQVDERPELDVTVPPTALSRLEATKQTLIMAKLRPLQKHFHRYLQIGGFPELALSNDHLCAQRVLREDVVDKVLKRDIPSLFSVRSPADLERIFLYLCYHSSSVINVASMAKELEGVSRPTVEKYIEHLRQANLVYVSAPINLSGKKALKTQNKIYIADPAIRNAVLMQSDLLINPAEMGLMVETAVYRHLQSFYYQSATRVGYYREAGKGDQEIDVVIQLPRGKVLVEVKYRETYDLAELQPLITHASDATATLLITKKDEDYGPLPASSSNVYRLPAYAFLYLLGHAERCRLSHRDNSVDLLH